MKNKKGKIKISSDMLADIDNSYRCFHALFSVFIPVFIDRDFNGSYYSGYCDLFDEIEIGEVIPEYEAILTESPEGYSVNFKRK